MAESYKKHFSDKNFHIAFWSGLGLLFLSLVAQFFVNDYVTKAMSESVTDIILSNTRVYNVGGIFAWATVALVLIGVIICARHINYVPFVAKSIALFTLIRSVFVSLTHISPFPTRAVINTAFFHREAFNGILTGNDLFFSGHTGVPFLLALIFWDNKPLRIIFLCFSILLAIVVLLGHLHYSIDVLSAYFITFSIFEICKVFFKKDLAIFNSNKTEVK